MDEVARQCCNLERSSFGSGGEGYVVLDGHKHVLLLAPKCGQILDENYGLVRVTLAITSETTDDNDQWVL